MPKATDEDWAVVAAPARARVPEALTSYRRSLAEGRDRGIVAGPRQVEAPSSPSSTVGGGRRLLLGLRGRRTGGALARLRPAGAGADAAIADMRDWLAAEYAPAASGRRDAVGRERYTRWARYWTGSDLDVDEAPTPGAGRSTAGPRASSAAEAAKVLPGATPWRPCAS